MSEKVPMHRMIAVLLLVLLASMTLIAAGSYNPFIYFRF